MSQWLVEISCRCVGPRSSANIAFVPGALETLIDGLARYSWRTFVGIFVAGAALLLFADRLGVRDWLTANRVYVVIALLVSGAILLTHLGTLIHARVADRGDQRIDLRMVAGEPLHASWSIGQSPLDKKPMMILVCSMNFAHLEDGSVILKRGYFQGTREVFAMTPITVGGAYDPRESFSISVAPIKAKPGKTLKGRLIFVDQFNNKHKSGKLIFRPNTLPDDFVKTRILTASPNCAFCGKPVTFEDQAKEAQMTAHAQCIWD
jgi:hypothetical protein